MLMDAGSRQALTELGKSEVENLYASIAGDEDILRLQIPMQDALVVGGRQAAGNLHGEV